MRVPESLVPLVDQGIIQRVIRPLMSGKEAQIFLVESRDELRVAKVYKEASHRSFKHRADYTEGRRTRSTRGQRAMAKRSKFGKKEVEDAWRTAEVNAIYKLRDAGVLVPQPYEYIEGVLIMELVCGEDGEPAPRLADVDFSPAQAKELFKILIREVVKMLCAGVVHGDLSDFNVLIGPNGPVVIDFPQWVDPAFNTNAQNLLIRDVRNLTSFLARHAPGLKKTRYADEIWGLYSKGTLTPTTPLTGQFEDTDKQADVDSIVAEIQAATRAEEARREALGLPPPRRARAPVEIKGPRPRPVGERNESRNSAGGSSEGGGRRKRKRNRRKGGGDDRGPAPQRQQASPRAERPPAKVSFDDLDALLDFDD
ncbi:MAG: PA4780 family RIO1-like protein kinase [Myxococcota bacterium]